MAEHHCRLQNKLNRVVATSSCAMSRRSSTCPACREQRQSSQAGSHQRLASAIQREFPNAIYCGQRTRLLRRVVRSKDEVRPLVTSTHADIADESLSVGMFGDVLQVSFN